MATKEREQGKKKDEKKDFKAVDNWEVHGFLQEPLFLSWQQPPHHPLRGADRDKKNGQHSLCICSGPAAGAPNMLSSLKFPADLPRLRSAVALLGGIQCRTPALFSCSVTHVRCVSLVKLNELRGECVRYAVLGSLHRVSSKWVLLDLVCGHA